MITTAPQLRTLHMHSNMLGIESGTGGFRCTTGVQADDAWCSLSCTYEMAVYKERYDYLDEWKMSSYTHRRISYVATPPPALPRLPPCPPAPSVLPLLFSPPPPPNTPLRDHLIHCSGSSPMSQSRFAPHPRHAPPSIFPNFFVFSPLPLHRPRLLVGGTHASPP